MENGNVQEIPEITGEYQVEAEQVKSFQRDGHILLRHVASPSEVEDYRTPITLAVKQLNTQNKPLNERDTYGKAFIQISNIWESHENVRRFVLARRFAKLAADLMGVSGVRIYHDQALFKEPGGGHTPWHQDQIYWPLDTTNTITMWMPLVNIPQEVGSMTFASGSHKKGYINKLEISDESHRTLQQYIDHQQFPQVNYGGMNAGDATFHYGWTLHSAPGNPTELMREVMTVIYYADGSSLLEPDSNARRADLKRWFPGLQAGDRAISPLNPLVYSSD